MLERIEKQQKPRLTKRGECVLFAVGLKSLL
nr:MAG TPA_asm: hypothetical protein [Caudoviricetes sp.]